MDSNSDFATLRGLPQQPGLTIETPQRITLTYAPWDGVLTVVFPSGDRTSQPMNLLATLNLISRLRVEGTLTIPDEKIDAFIQAIDAALADGDALLSAKDLLDNIRRSSKGAQS